MKLAVLAHLFLFAVFLLVTSPHQEASANDLAKARANVHRLMRALKSKNTNVRRKAAYSLIKKRARAVGPLMSVADKGKGDSRICAIWILGSIGPKAAKAVPLLTRLATSSNAPVDYYATWALGRIGPKAASATQALVGIVNRTKPRASTRLRSMAVESLGHIVRKDSPAIGVIVGTLSESNDEITYAAYQSLVEIGTPAIPALIKGARGVGLGSKKLALFALCKMGSKARAVLPVARGELGAKHKEIRILATRIVARLAPEANLEALVRALGDKDWEVNIVASRALRLLKPGLSVPRLMKMLKTNNKTAPIWILGKIGPKARPAAPLIRRALTHANKTVRIYALWALVEILGRTPEVERALTTALRDAHKHVRSYAHEKLYLIEPKTAEARKALAAAQKTNPLKPMSVLIAKKYETPDRRDLFFQGEQITCRSNLVGQAKGWGYGYGTTAQFCPYCGISVRP